MKPLQETKAMNQPRRYKLLRDLPDYKVGEIYEWDGNKYYKAKHDCADGSRGQWPAKFVENNPEWFQEIVERDWEIVAIKDSLGRTLNVEVGSEFEMATGATHTVRRLSDGELFTVGETVVTNDGRGQHKINGFKIVDGDMCADMNTFLTKYEFISKIQKLPPQSTKEPEISDKEKEISLISRCLAYLSLDTTNVPQGLYKDVYNYLYPPTPAPQQPEAQEEKIDWSKYLNLKVTEEPVKFFINGVQLLPENNLAEEKAFNAAREGKLSYDHCSYTHLTFQDYLKSINPDQWKHEALKKEQASFNKK